MSEKPVPLIDESQLLTRFSWTRWKPARLYMLDARHAISVTELLYIAQEH
jgi:hypothetical protein